DQTIRQKLTEDNPTATLECVAQNCPRRITILRSPAMRETAFDVLINPCVRSVCSRSVAVGVFFFLFDDLRDQFSTGAWLDLRERNRQLLVKVAGGKITMVRHVVLDDAPACLDRLEFRMILRCTQNAMTSGFG